MTSNRTRSLLAAFAAAALLVACGGGDDDNKVRFGSVVSFGDSLSDAGTYKVGTVAALGGGRFTINGPGGKVWTEFLADMLGTPAQCPARTGMLPNLPGVTGAVVQDFANCFNYAEGSSRVTSEGSGPNGVALQAFGQQNLGFIADSLNEQFNRHLAKVGGAYKGDELVTINAGGNDLFMQLNGVFAAAGGGAAAAAAATIAGWPQQVIDAVAAGGPDATNTAAAAAVAAMGQAGADLASYVKTLVAGKGARHIVVRNLGDVNLTPFGLTFDAATKGLITNMTTAFDGQLKTGLDGIAGVVIYDEYAQGAEIAADPAKFGFSNITTPACAPNEFSTPGQTYGPSIVCTTGKLVAGDTSRYRFSDDVHPTPYAHQFDADTVLALMAAAGWR
jgi:phospholipase/lecithinase/hemolysin